MAKLSRPEGNRTPIRSTSSTPISKIPVRSIPGTLILSLCSLEYPPQPKTFRLRRVFETSLCEKHSCLLVSLGSLSV